MTSRQTLLAAALGSILISPPASFGQSTPGVPVPQQAPPRDARAGSQTGTAVIRGRVVAADTGRPLRRAQIRVTAPELGTQPKTTSTNPDGRFELKDLPAGRYTVQVTRSGYLQLSYGQRRPLEQGKPLQLADRQIVEHIDFALPRTSVITGRIFDELGEPVADAQVFAMRLSYFQGRRRMTPVNIGLRSDDAGQYRITGLAPGSYYVMAMLRDTWTVTENGVDVTFGYAPTYYPGSPGTTNARRVMVGVGEEAPNTDFALVPGRSASISGVALDSQGRPLAGRSVSLNQEVRGNGMAMMSTAGSGTVAPDGSFTIKNVPPGEYKLTAQSANDARAAGSQLIEAASIPIVIDGVDLTNMQLTTSSGWSARGRIVTDTGSIPGIPANQVRIAARPIDSDRVPNAAGTFDPESGRVRDDWTVTVTNIFGAAQLNATVPDGWMVASIMQNGTDVSDAALQMKGGEELSDLQVVITSRVTTVMGQLTDDKASPVDGGTVVVFASDSMKWGEGSRWVKVARPDQQGRYQIRGLPPGEYLAVALDYVENGLWNDPEYLDSIRSDAQRIRLLDGGSATPILKIRPAEAR
jgi:hypothetical protein